MLDPHDHWRDKALVLLRAIAAQFVPPGTKPADLEDIMAVLGAAPELRQQVGRILAMRWTANNAEFDEFVTTMEREQRFDGAVWCDFQYLTNRRRLARDGINAAARDLLATLPG